MLDNKIIKQINDFVYIKPRTVQEIALLIKKNQRTANRYVDLIAEQEGNISTRIFREGTKGALKIVHWNSIEKIHSSEFQERLFKYIESGRTKDDFSPSEIYQYVDSNKKSAKILINKIYSSKENFDDFANLLRSADSQILFFSGNLTFSNISYHDKKNFGDYGRVSKTKYKN